MSGNTFGTLFTVTSFGESHGPAIGCVVDGCPPGLSLCEADIQAELDRRKPGTSRHVTQRREPDTKLANALYPITLEENGLKDIIENFQTCYKKGYLNMMLQKLGLKESYPTDETLISELTQTMKDTQCDMTIFFRLLSDVNDNMTPSEAYEIISKSLYLDINDEDIKIVWQRWFLKYLDRLKDETISNEERKVIMDKAKPKYVLRNYMAQITIEAADKGDYSVIHVLYQLLKQPYAEQPEYQHWFEKRPEWAIKKVGCSMLSCSS